jgi:predicted RNA binding protein YcfA (HicA-like mRNA interferase family)
VLLAVAVNLPRSSLSRAPPKCTFREFIAIIEQHKFYLLRQEGSHRQYRDPSGKVVTVAYHNINDPILLKTLES